MFISLARLTFLWLIAVEAVRLPNVPMQTHRKKLREHVDPIEAAVDAVGKRDVDQPVLASKRHRRLGAKSGERLQPRAATASQYQRNRIFHSSNHAKRIF